MNGPTIYTNLTRTGVEILQNLYFTSLSKHLIFNIIVNINQSQIVTN